MPSFIILQTFVFDLLNVKQLNINTYADIDKNQTEAVALNFDPICELSQVVQF
jgi:hypothetical protein